MNLFSRLLRLHAGVTPTEDFFTEIVAHLFSVSRVTLFAWLEYTQLLDTQSYTHVTVSTQQSFDALTHHTSASRPDILIELSDGYHIAWIVIESKIGSGEGVDQLKRYAEIMAARQDVQKKILVYLTRNYDPKDRNEIFAEIPQTDVAFRQLRWHTFYTFLRSRPEDQLLTEIIKFMEEYRMAQSNRFTETDISALSNIPAALSIVYQTLSDEVSARFKEITGFVPGPARILPELQYGRYDLHCYFANGLFCGLGYDLVNVSIANYPNIQLRLDLSPKASIQVRQEIIRAMQTISQRPYWRGENLSTTTNWSRVIRERSLHEFLVKDDQVHEIKRYFLELLEELSLLKKQYPTLFQLDT